MGKDTKKPKGFAMETPIGAIKVMVSEDEDNPGIVLAFVDKEGMERSYCMLEYSEADESMMARVWGPENKDGDAIFTHKMSL